MMPTAHTNAQMVMTSRVLPPEEYPRLADTDFGTTWQDLHPAWTRILVVEDGDRIVGCWALLNHWHLEGLWIAPEYRQRPSVARRIWVGMRKLMASVGATGAITGAVAPDIDQMLSGRAIALPGRFYVLNMDTEELCQPPLSLH